MTTITRSKGGTAERTVDSAAIQIPDLWHIAEWLDDNGKEWHGKQIREAWHLAHDLLRHIIDQDRANAGSVSLDDLAAIVDDLAAIYREAKEATQ